MPQGSQTKNDALWKEAIEVEKAFDLFDKKDYEYTEDYFYGGDTEDTKLMVDTCRGFIKENHKKELDSLSAEQQENVLIMSTWLSKATCNLSSFNALKEMCELDFNNKETSKTPIGEGDEVELEFRYGTEAIEGKAKWLNVLRNHPLKEDLFGFVGDYFFQNEGVQGNYLSVPTFNQNLAQETEAKLQRHENLEITQQKATSNTKKTMLSPQLMAAMKGKTR